MRYMKSTAGFEMYMNNFLIGQEKDFIIVEKNGSKKAIWDAEKNLGAYHREKLPEGEMKHLWIFAYVNRQFKKYLKNNPDYKIFTRRNAVKTNRPSISKLKVDQKFYATDAKHCYWRVAYGLGYINEKLYTMLLDPKYKEYRNKALACVKGTIRTHHFKKGKLVKTTMTGNPDMNNLYENIRNASYSLMMDCAEACGDDFLKYKTDCVYYLPKKRRTVEAIFRKMDMGYETTECYYLGENSFLEVDEIKKF